MVSVVVVNLDEPFFLPRVETNKSGPIIGCYHDHDDTTSLQCSQCRFDINGKPPGLSGLWSCKGFVVRTPYRQDVVVFIVQQVYDDILCTFTGVDMLPIHK